MDPELHAFGEETEASVYLWAVFLVIVAVLLYVDLFLASPASRKGSQLQEAVKWSVIYVVLSLVFCAWLAVYFSTTVAEEYLAGYLIEKSLSVDNMFVMLLTFKMFRIGKDQQKELLVWGIVGAIVMRACFIATGSWILHHFAYAMYLFGGILLFAAIKMVVSGEEDETEPPAIANFLKKVLPWDDNLTLHGESASKFFVRGQDGKMKITPQFACLIVIEVGDIIFAVDSIPAIFAVTEDPFVVFTSNIFAIMGLRSMFFVLSTILTKLEYLQMGLAAILGFVGVKMLIADFFHIPTWASLVYIIGVLALVGLAGKIMGSKHGHKKDKNSFDSTDSFDSFAYANQSSAGVSGRRKYAGMGSDSFV